MITRMRVGVISFLFFAPSRSARCRQIKTKTSMIGYMSAGHVALILDWRQRQTERKSDHHGMAFNWPPHVGQFARNGKIIDPVAKNTFL